MTELPFHPAVTAWFLSRFDSPTPPQTGAWRSLGERRSTLIAAPTGSGKTLAAFLSAVDGLVREAEHGPLPDHTSVLYISPLKALSNDIERNLQVPLRGIDAVLEARGQEPSGIRVLVRTGDTPQGARAAMVKRPPHIVVTTPESFYLLLTSEKGRALLSTVRTVIVDEIHALAGDKRGTHLALSLERLEALTGRPPVRIGLSATQKPIAEIARFLVGGARVNAEGTPECTIVDHGHRRALDLAVEVPDSPLEAVMSADVWKEVYDRLATLIEEHRTTLVFVNTRRLAERVTQFLSERLGSDQVTSHHGSLSREHRLAAEQQLKSGSLRAVVATASLELGIDVGDVDLVCQIGSTRSIAAFLQRVGRSGHWVGAVPRGRLFPLTRDELAESAALLRSIGQGTLDHLRIPGGALDILAQQIVAEVSAREWEEDALFEVLRRAWPYRELRRADFDAVLRMLGEGFSTRRGRRGAYLHRDLVNRRLRPRRGARLAAITSGGAIPDNADYQVVLEPTGAVVGSLNEDFAIESSAGDIFQLGNASWRILRVEAGKVRVADAQGQPPTIPFWFGEAPARTAELSAAVSSLRGEIGHRLEADDHGALACAWVESECGLGVAAARQLVDYLEVGRRSLGLLPTQECLVLERFFDESGGMQMVLHAPFGGRINRAWGLALRKRFCRSFNFELQAAATEDAIVLSLGATHSFPLEDVFRFLNAATVRDVLTQALLDAPMFGVRWRWNAGRALAILRFRAGKKVPPQLQRMQAEDLLSVVFPDQLACLENIAGEREIPDHPLVNQTLADCLHEAMDIDGLEALLASIERGEHRLVARDLTEPSPFAAEILNAKPYAFLDDAPLEERRTQAVMSRRWLDPRTASDLGALDLEAIARVREEAAPEAETSDELHDALVMVGGLSETEVSAHPTWGAFIDDLREQRRVSRIRAGGGPETEALWIPAERIPEWRAGLGEFEAHPSLEAPPGLPVREWSPEDARMELVRGRLEVAGPVSVETLAARLHFTAAEVEHALLRLEGEGFVLRGSFTPGSDGPEWCERRLLARIHRYTLNRLRREIEPVQASDFLRFLFQWQGAAPEARGQGPEALARVLDQLEGFEAPASAWESCILPGRVRDYDPSWLDNLCLSGRFLWARLSPPAPSDSPSRGAGPIRATPMALVSRRRWENWARSGPGIPDRAALSSVAAEVWRALERRGASFHDELAREAGLLPSQVEDGLRELVYLGRVTADSFSGLRALLLPANRRGSQSPGRRRRPRYSVQEAGRWTRIAPPAQDPPDTPPHDRDRIEEVARALLRRYGVVFHRVLQRESALPPWRDLLWALRRLEARGDVRGGRFVDGFTGEQYALPEAVGMLRDVRKRVSETPWVSLSAADPLNLVGILTPDGRVPALTGNRVLFRGGIPVAVRVAGEDRILAAVPEVAPWELHQRLARSAEPGGAAAPTLSAY